MRNTMLYHSRWIITLLVAALPLAGCGRAREDAHASNQAFKGAAAVANSEQVAKGANQVAAVKQPTEESGISRLTLSDKAAKRLGIEVAEVKANGEVLEAPYSALLYDASGGEWVYVSPDPLVFKRAGIKVERIEGDKMYLSKGPAAGTKVVAVGAAELFGTEFEVGH
jgi:hypothetical protein